ncbi:MAG: CRTAC1 family protein [Planctomycetales bacterium]|nr:CRTAC1 family protein [Planctomycetales bacterium]
MSTKVICRVFFFIVVVVGFVGCGEKTERLSSETVPDARGDESGNPSRPVHDDSESTADLDEILGDLAADDRRPDDSETTPSENKPVSKEMLLEKRRELDSTVWSQERLAQEYERALVRLWDSLLQAQRTNGDAYSVFRHLPFDSIRIGSFQIAETLDNQIEQFSQSNPTSLDPAGWGKLVDWVKSEDYSIVQTEWHHATFQPQSESQNATSTVNMAIYVKHEARSERWVLQGQIDIRWQSERDADGIPLPQSVDASRLELLRHQGPVPFKETLTVDQTQPKNLSGVQPVLVYDLDKDGLSEVLLGGCNLLYRNLGDGKFEPEPLFSYPYGTFETGLIADMNGDSYPDYVTAGKRGDLLVYLGNAEGKFVDEPLGKARGGGPLRQPQAITTGDIDLDGDLDIWIAQYRISYLQGEMPQPYYDANDGYPAFLLLNDGTGKLTPATEEAGLAAKRNRRTYGSSFLDWDEDGDLDLIVISDFSGVDLYENDGTGKFTDVTDKLDQRHIFGMSASFADFNLDGKLDFFVTGMASTTARRLEFMKLGREDRPEVHAMRSIMGYGNRMYLAQGDVFHQPAFKDSVARTGWSWGSTAFDFDNDGDKDLFVANGHSSGKSTKDHCSHFWCHDIYEDGSAPKFAVSQVFQDVLEGYLDRSESWDGYQKNSLLMNEAGQKFRSIGFLMGVGQEYDGRAVVGDDLDADGRVDLVVVEDRWQDGQLLHVYQNQWSAPGHWIGVRLQEEGQGRSPHGARVVAQAGERRWVASVVSGDSIHAQHPATVHFGLGEQNAVDSLEVIWPGGHTQRIENPAVDQYHQVLYDGSVN